MTSPVQGRGEQVLMTPHEKVRTLRTLNSADDDDALGNSTKTPAGGSGWPTSGPPPHPVQLWTKGRSKRLLLLGWSFINLYAKGFLADWLADVGGGDSSFVFLCFFVVVYLFVHLSLYETFWHNAIWVIVLSADSGSGGERKRWYHEAVSRIVVVFQAGFGWFWGVQWTLTRQCSSSCCCPLLGTNSNIAPWVRGAPPSVWWFDKTHLLRSAGVVYPEGMIDESEFIPVQRRTLDGTGVCVRTGNVTSRGSDRPWGGMNFWTVVDLALRSKKKTAFLTDSSFLLKKLSLTRSTVQ